MTIKTLSIPKDLNDYLISNPALSPSKLLQSKIREIMERRLFTDVEIKRLKGNIVFLNRKLEEAGDRIVFLEKKLRE